MTEWAFLRFGPRFPLNLKLAVPVVLTTAIAALVLGSVVVGAVRAQISNVYDQQADTIAGAVQADVATRPADIDGLNLYLTNLALSRTDLISIRVHSTSAGFPVIASSNPSEVGLTGLVETDEARAILTGSSLQNRESSRGGETLQTERPLWVGGQLFGAVVVTNSTAPEDSAIGFLSWAIAASFGAAVMVEAGFILLILNFGILRRARRMRLAIAAVEEGGPSVRLAEGREPAGRDELFGLARQVDHMIGTLDERRRADAVIRRLGQHALEGVAANALIGEGLVAARDVLALESCWFIRVEGGRIVHAVDDRARVLGLRSLPVWLAALVTMSARARKPVLTDRMGQNSRIADLAVDWCASVALVPLPQAESAGATIVAMAGPGGNMSATGLAMLESVAATIAESIQRQNAAEARYESAVKSKVMALMSHELRNPLNSILGFTSLVLSSEKEVLTEKQRRQLGFVQASATNMLALVTNTSELARIRSGSLALQLEAVALAPVIQEVIATLHDDALARQVSIRLSVAADLKARVDASRFRQVMTNLVGNAIKFTPAGGRIAIRARPETDSVRVAIGDNGVGIARAHQSQVFMEFAKIDAGSEARGRGVGLGLALAKGYVEAMGGTIGFKSRPGRGTVFVIQLPIVEASHASVRVA